MSNSPEDFEQLRKLLKIKRYEQPPPGYYSRFSGLVVNRLEREGESQGALAEVPWLRKLFGIFESSPVAAGAFGAALCGLVIFGMAAANQADKAPAIAFVPAASGTADANAKDAVALNTSSQVIGGSTDAMFGANIPGSPFTANNNAPARVEPVSFSTTPQ